MSFRQFGGLQYAPRHNIVGSNYNSINNLQVTQNVGQPASYINCLSDISVNTITSSDVYTFSINVINNATVGTINNIIVGQGGGSQISNIAIGFDALNNNTTGADNIALGLYSLTSNITGIQNVALGNVALGATTGNNNVALGYISGSSLEDGDNNLFLGARSNTNNVSINNATAIGYNAIVNTSNTIMLGGDNSGYPSVIVPGSQSIGKTTLPTQTLDVEGNIVATGTITSGSDYRIKENIIPLDESYTVENLKPVTYHHKIASKQDIGLIAHELQEVYPYLVNGEKDGAEYQSINYIGLIPILINEIKWLKKEVKILKEIVQNKIDYN